MKAFTFGIIVGAVLCFAIFQIADLRDSEVVSEEAARDTTPVAHIQPYSGASCPDARTVQPVPIVNTIASSPEQRTQTPEARERHDSSALQDVSLTRADRRFPIEDLSEKEAFDLCHRANQLREEKERAAKSAEPKDPGWAYSMEQLVRQHVESYLPAEHYTNLRIECRTTFCELRMEGAAMEGQELAEKVLKEIQYQPWSDIVHKGGGSGSDGKTWHVEYEWYRPQTEIERRTWFGIRDQSKG